MNTSESVILVVDDEPNTLKVVSAVLQKQGYSVSTALNFESAWAVLEKEPIQIVITDLKLPDKSGLELLEGVKKKWPDINVIMITAYGTIDNAVQAMKLGAYNYLTKPVNPEELQVVITKALEKDLLLEENLDLKKQLRERYRLGNIVGRSKVMQELFVLVEKIAGYESNILITGETGTGKELIAKAIHYSGKLQEKPFVTIDCAAIPESILESELFGHTKGAFTGAVEDKKGQIEM
ncbi:MAG TPA: sigma 54-interacting transcriptional regulator, partial [Desulfohalobiaceae bacterium]|nr:sigma 54-interacting transcriptional regulator [Desulfohalobiaceae bacterium]